jgi:hypothetical protein
MDESPHDRRHSPAAGIGRVAAALFREMAPKILFFFIAFMILFVLYKLFVAQYSITYTAFTRAAVAALILGKVVPLLDWAQSGYRFDTHRRIVVIAGKTLIYALVVIALGTGERMFEAYRTVRTVQGALKAEEAQANLSHFLGLVLLISLVVGGYLTLQAIDEALGKGTLFRILFGRPQDRARDA